MLINHMQKASERITALRRQNNMTQSQLADKLGVSRSCVANWENCIREPDASNLLALSNQFRVSVEYLCGRSDLRSEVKIPRVYNIDFADLNPEGRKQMVYYFEYLLTQKRFQNKKPRSSKKKEIKDEEADS